VVQADWNLAAQSGSRHLEFLLANQLIKFSPSAALGTAYAQASTGSSLKLNAAGLGSETSIEVREQETEERMLLSKSSGKGIAQFLQVPEIEVEIERAIWQIEKSLKERSLKTENERRKRENFGEASKKS